MLKKEYSIEIGGKMLTAEFNNLAERAHGSVLVKYGNTTILATAVMSTKSKESGDFFPLTVDFEEKFYATGRILGSRFVRREGKPSDEAVLSGRIVDRTIRPLFDQWIRHETQVIITVLSIDEEDPDVLGVIGASLALGVSNIPWNGPVGAIRIGKIKGQNDFILNPTYAWRDTPDLEFELVACGQHGTINMVELGGNETVESTVSKALVLAAEEISKLQKFQETIIKEIGVPKRSIPQQVISKEATTLFEKEIAPKMDEYVFTGIPGDSKIYELKDLWLAVFEKALPEEHRALAENFFEEKVNALIHHEAVLSGRRPDGRGTDDIRPLYAQAGGVSSILHGSGIFFRGQTHILSVLTLGGPQDVQLIEGVGEEEKKRFMHHYNFPPFSTGETGRTGANRRMIGHGALAEKALAPMIPSQETFPYTIRLVSEALSSNGSTSMASICGGTLALMDGGVPIKKPVAGISSGVMIVDEKNYKVLTDIQGPEDHFGDMDFKVAGTRDGITAIQMDVKVKGIPVSILTEAFGKAKIARLAILDVIESAIKEPRKSLSSHAPKIISMTVKQDHIGLVIGPGGKTIKTIIEKTAVLGIDINDNGIILITGKNGSAEKAEAIIKTMVGNRD
ncbi:MAG TPA: polyribonucleotide nucleotidyltransferase [Candidatus Paceibacterota bacterium]